MVLIAPVLGLAYLLLLDNFPYKEIRESGMSFQSLIVRGRKLHDL